MKKIILFGGLGGLINASLCYWRLPVRVEDFQWHIIPAGFFHGALLVGLTVVGAAFFSKRGHLWRIIGAVATGYVVGWITWIPIRFSITDAIQLKSVWWPVDVDDLGLLWAPLETFGFVSLLLYLWLVYGARYNRAILIVIFCASLGSLWFWIEWKHWYLCLLHGAIWGGLVAIAMKKYQTNQT